MPRHKRRHPDRLEQLRLKVHELYDGSHLEPVGEKLRALISETQAAISVGSAKPEMGLVVYNSVTGILQLLPQAFGPRFDFDAVVLGALAEQWSQGAIQLSNMLVPKLDETWGYQRVVMPSIDQNDTHSVDVVLFPGENSLSHIDLLSYPWICHEMGHNVLYRNHEGFINLFQGALDKVIHALRLRASADQGAARDKARRIIEEVRQVWSPTPDHRNWAHELAIDMIALWTCGPAYLAAFYDEVDSSEVNPYRIDQNHPPYETRGLALIEASGDLGWSSHTSDLKRHFKETSKSQWRKERTNRYVALTSPELVRSCVSSSFEICKVLGLPRCTPEHLNQARDILHRDAIPDFGRELLLTAWLVHLEQGSSKFEHWEQRVIKTLIDDHIKQ